MESKSKFFTRASLTRVIRYKDGSVWFEVDTNMGESFCRVDTEAEANEELAKHFGITETIQQFIERNTR